MKDEWVVLFKMSDGEIGFLLFTDERTANGFNSAKKGRILMSMKQFAGLVVQVTNGSVNSWMMEKHSDN